MITVDYSQTPWLQAAQHHAQTIEPENLGTHASGWVIEGDIIEDWYEWVNEFKAVHPEYGVIEGDFENEVTAESQEAIDHFVEHVGYEEWDYWDI